MEFALLNEPRDPVAHVFCRLTERVRPKEHHVIRLVLEGKFRTDLRQQLRRLVHLKAHVVVLLLVAPKKAASVSRRWCFFRRVGSIRSSVKCATVLSPVESTATVMKNLSKHARAVFASSVNAATSRVRSATSTDRRTSATKSHAQKRQPSFLPWLTFARALDPRPRGTYIPAATSYSCYLFLCGEGVGGAKVQVGVVHDLDEILTRPLCAELPDDLLQQVDDHLAARGADPS